MILVVFLLLLSSGALLAHRDREIAALRASFSQYDSLLAPVAAEAAQRGIPIKDTDELVSLILRGAAADRLRSELAKTKSELGVAKAANDEKSSEVTRLRRVIANTSYGTQELAAKAAEDDALRAMLERASPQDGTGEERLRRVLDQAAGTAASDSSLTGQNAQMRTELARLKGNGGSGLPYCWTTPEGRPIYMLRIELRDNGVVVRDIDPRARPDDHAWELLDPVARNETISISALLSAVSLLQAQAVAARCRYAVLAFDGTARTNKPGYKSLMGHLWSAFMVHEVGR